MKALDQVRDQDLEPHAGKMPGLEAVLLHILSEGHLTNDQKIEVIERLGQIGTAESVPELRTHCDEFFDPGGPKRAARAAIAAVQARIKNAHVGQLTVVGDDTMRGGLSESEQ
jgi:hypothetical protein